MSVAAPADPLVGEPFGHLPGLDPRWSRRVTAADADGVPRTWHLLDNGAEPTVGTLLCVHGNPTWSYLWRRFLASAPAGWRVVAVDQLGMGWSEQPARPRRLAQRVADLGSVSEVLGITGPTVVAAHDWGGPISLGWALNHRDQLAGLILANTAVASLTDGLPSLLRLARAPALRTAVCVWTPTFVAAAAALSRPTLPRSVRAGLAAPYRRAHRRRAIGDFVADIPVEADHASRPALDAIAAGVAALGDVPTLLLWGPRDPVFSSRYLRDLQRRLPHADVHRYPRASHLVTEDAPQTAEHAWAWVRTTLTSPAAPAAAGRSDEVAPTQPLWTALPARAGDAETAVVELGAGRPRRTSFAELEARVRDVAAGLAAAGVRAGDRVALLIPPGVDLTVVVYACWRVSATIVVADAGLGLTALGDALRSADPQYVVGVGRGLAAAALLGVPGRRVATGRLPAPLRRLLGVEHTMPELAQHGRGAELPAVPDLTGDAAVLFTSGATGPPKGVVYRHHQLRAQLDLVRGVCGIGQQDRLVAAFAPFALYGPALGVGAAVPDMDVTSPGTLTASALATAVEAVDATVVFASPAALRNVVATAAELTATQTAALAGVRRVLSAGAPVPLTLLRSVAALLPAAEIHTPYGMTEALPVTDISLAELEAAGSGNGVCVGRPLPKVTVRISPLTPLGQPGDDLTEHPGVTGEVCVAAAHVKERYDRLWGTEQESSRTPGWHRTGDVGHLDQAGRLWVEGRLVHVITTPAGPVTPVGVEQRIEALPPVTAAAAVGVGPRGTQQLVAVVVPAAGPDASVLADPALAAAVRSAAGVPVTAVLVVAALPVDIRHASKVDRSRLARWADRVLAGERPRRP